jgi:hypothetical protein
VRRGWTSSHFAPGAALLLRLFVQGAFDASSEAPSIGGGVELLTRYAEGKVTLLDSRFWRRADARRKRERGKRRTPPAQRQKGRLRGRPRGAASRYICWLSVPGSSARERLGCWNGLTAADLSAPARPRG